MTALVLHLLTVVYLLFRLYSTIAKASYGAVDNTISEMHSSLNRKLSRLVTERGVLGEIMMRGKDVVAALVTPIMQRAHTLRFESLHMNLKNASNSENKYDPVL